MLTIFDPFKSYDVRIAIVASASMLQSINFQLRQVFYDPLAYLIVAKVLLLASFSQKASVGDREMLGIAIFCLFFEGIPPMLKLFRSIQHH